MPADARRFLLEGAMHAGRAMHAGVGLGHAMAQVLGGRYGLPHGAMHAVSLPVALRFNSTVAGANGGSAHAPGRDVVIGTGLVGNADITDTTDTEGRGG